MHWMHCNNVYVHFDGHPSRGRQFGRAPQCGVRPKGVTRLIQPIVHVDNAGGVGRFSPSPTSRCQQCVGPKKLINFGNNIAFKQPCVRHHLLVNTLAPSDIGICMGKNLAQVRCWA